MRKVIKLLISVCLIIPILIMPVDAASNIRVEAENYNNISGGASVQENYYIGYQNDGSYMTYTVNIPQTGYYQMKLNVATQDSEKYNAFELIENNVVLIEAGTQIPITAAWNSFKEIYAIHGVYLTAGVHTLTLKSRTPSWNLDWFEFIYVSELAPVKTQASQSVEVTMSIEEHAGEDKSWYNNDYSYQYKNTQMDSIDLGVSSKNNNIIYVNPYNERQDYYGFGTSVDESTVHNLWLMDEATRYQFIKNLVDPVNGAGINLFRLTIGTADFVSVPFYTYYDGTGTELNGQPDWYNTTGNGFSIQKDIDYHIIDTIHLIQEAAMECGVEDQLKFFASPWTPPGWMKTQTSYSRGLANNSLLLKSGSFNSNFTDAYATYFVRYLEEYQKQGIQIEALTLQNEPYLEVDYPSCLMTGQQQAALASAVKQKIQQSSVLEKKNTQIWGFDHNFNIANQYINEASNQAGWADIDGIAFHPYGGVAESMGTIHAQTGKDVYLSERAVWGASGASSIMDWFRNGARSYNSWVTMLDTNKATHQWTGEPGPTMFIQYANNRNQYKILPEYYIEGQFSKYITSGDLNIDSTKIGNQLNSTAFKKSDGTIVLVVSNTSGYDQNFTVVCDQDEFNATLPKGCVATYRWKNSTQYPEKEYIDVPAVVDNSRGTINSQKSYDINVLEDGNYTLTYCVQNTHDNNVTLQTKIDNDIISSLACAKTWSNTNLYMKDTVYLKAGKQTLTLDVSDTLQINSLVIEKADSAIAVGENTTIQAEQFYQGNGTFYVETDSIGQKNVGFTSTDSYVDYLVDVNESGKYTLSLEYSKQSGSTTAKIDSIVDNQTFDLISIPLSATSDWTVYKNTEQQEITLSEGIQTIRIYLDSYNLRNISLLKVEEEIPVSETVDILKARFSSTSCKGNSYMGLIVTANQEVNDIVVYDETAGQECKKITWTCLSEVENDYCYSMCIKVPAGVSSRKYTIYVIDQEGKRSKNEINLTLRIR